MQYKRTGIVDKAAGVTAQLKNQKTYDVGQGNELTIFRDENGKNWVVNGHHRLELANRAEKFVGEVPVKDAEGNPTNKTRMVQVPRRVRVKVLDARDGWTPEMAKTRGAIENMREGKGEPIDAADALASLDDPAVISEHVRSLPQTTFSRDIAGLVKLGQAGRDAVRNGEVSQQAAAAIGDVLGNDPERVRVAMEQARKNGVSTYREAADMAVRVREEPIVRREDAKQLGFEGFDNDSEYVSTAGSQAKIRTELEKRLSDEKSKLLATEKTEARPGETFDTEGRRADAAAIGEAKSKAALLLDHDPEVKAALRQVATEHAQGKVTTQDAAARMRDVLLENAHRTPAEVMRRASDAANPSPDQTSGNASEGQEALFQRGRQKDTETGDLFGGPAEPGQSSGGTNASDRGVVRQRDLFTDQGVQGPARGGMGKSTYDQSSLGGIFDETPTKKPEAAPNQNTLFQNGNGSKSDESASDFAARNSYANVVRSSQKAFMERHPAGTPPVFSPDAPAVAKALQNPDPMAATRDLGHILRRALYREVQEGQSTRFSKDDIARLEQAYDIKPGQGNDGKWSTDASDRFSEDWSRYLQDGKAPTTRLQKVFDAFRSWLTRIYASLHGTPLEGEIHPAVRDIFDRLLAGDESASRNEAAAPAAPEAAARNEAATAPETTETPKKEPGTAGIQVGGKTYDRYEVSNHAEFADAIHKAAGGRLSRQKANDTAALYESAFRGIAAKQGKTVAQVYRENARYIIAGDAALARVLGDASGKAKGALIPGSRFGATAEDRHTLLALLANPDASTAIHELGHIFLNNLKPADANIVRRWLNDNGYTIGPNEPFATSHHEAFAQAFERSVAEGHVLHPSLSGVYARFKQFLKNVYTKVVTKLSPTGQNVQTTVDRTKTFPLFDRQTVNMLRSYAKDVSDITASGKSSERASANNEPIRPARPGTEAGTRADTGAGTEPGAGTAAAGASGAGGTGNDLLAPGRGGLRPPGAQPDAQATPSHGSLAPPPQVKSRTESGSAPGEAGARPTEAAAGATGAGESARPSVEEAADAAIQASQNAKPTEETRKLAQKAVQWGRDRMQRAADTWQQYRLTSYDQDSGNATLMSPREVDAQGNHPEYTVNVKTGYSSDPDSQGHLTKINQQLADAGMDQRVVSKHVHIARQLINQEVGHTPDLPQDILFQNGANGERGEQGEEPIESTGRWYADHIEESLRNGDAVGPTSRTHLLGSAKQAEYHLRSAGLDTSALRKAIDALPPFQAHPGTFDRHAPEVRAANAYREGAGAIRKAILKTVQSRITEPASNKSAWRRELAAYDNPVEGPTVKHNFNTIDNVETGDPLSLTGFRQSRGEGIPGTGRFYAIDPSLAGGYGQHKSIGEFLRTTNTGGPMRSLEVTPIQAKRAFVVEGGHRAVLREMEQQGVNLTDQDRSRLSAALATVRKSSSEEGEAGYQQLDKIVNGILNRNGYDALVYRHDTRGSGAGQSNETEVAVMGDVPKYGDRVLFQNAGEENPQTKTPEFKKWFGESKVVDDHGEPLAVYHGSPSGEPFTHFDASKMGNTTGAASAKEGFFFTDSPQVASTYADSSKEPDAKVLTEWADQLSNQQLSDLSRNYQRRSGRGLTFSPDHSISDNVDREIAAEELESRLLSHDAAERHFPADDVLAAAKDAGIPTPKAPYKNAGSTAKTYLSLKNPATMDAHGQNSGDINLTEFLKNAKAQGRDGAIIRNVSDAVSPLDDKNPPISTVYVAFNPTQIKSATGNRGTFDADNPNILFQKGAEPEEGDFFVGAEGKEYRVKSVNPDGTLNVNVSRDDGKFPLTLKNIPAQQFTEMRDKYDPFAPTPGATPKTTPLPQDQPRGRKIPGTPVTGNNPSKPVPPPLNTSGAPAEDAKGLLPPPPNRQRPTVNEAAGALGRGALRVGQEAMNAARSVKASGNLHQFGRQMAVLGPANPRAYALGVVDGVKAISKAGYEASRAQMEADPKWKEFAGIARQEFGRYLGDVHGKKNTDLGPNGQDEEFVSSLADKYIPGVAVSHRSFGLSLDRQGLEFYKSASKQLEKSGITLQNNPKAYRDLTGFVLASQGRLPLQGRLAALDKGLNSVFFSPRFAASRWKLMNPLYYSSLAPGARRVAIQTSAGYALTVAAAMGAAHMLGAKVSANPADPDFGKVKFGNARYDLTAGFRTEARMALQMYHAYRAQADGKKARKSMLDIAEQYARGKLAPGPSAIASAMAGKTVIGDRATPAEIAQDAYLPMFVDDVYRAYMAEGLPGVAKVTPAFFGVMSQDYKKGQHVPPVTDALMSRVIGQGSRSNGGGGGNDGTDELPVIEPAD